MTRREIKAIASTTDHALVHYSGYSVISTIGYYQPSNANWCYVVQEIRPDFWNHTCIVVTRFGQIVGSNLY